MSIRKHFRPIDRSRIVSPIPPKYKRIAVKMRTGHAAYLFDVKPTTVSKWKSEHKQAEQS